MDIDRDLNNRIDRALTKLKSELLAAMSKHRGMASAHEGHSVIREELDELWEHVRADTGDTEEARKEAMQIAAMGLRYALDVCPPFDVPKSLQNVYGEGDKVDISPVFAVAPRFVKTVHVYGDSVQKWIVIEGLASWRLTGELTSPAVAEEMVARFVRANPAIVVERYPKDRRVPAMYRGAL